MHAYLYVSVYYINFKLYIPYTAQPNQSFNTSMIDNFIVINNFMNKHVRMCS